MTWLQLNKCEIKQPVKFSKPHVRTNFHTQKKYKKNKLYKVFKMVHGTNGLHMVRIVRGTNSQWYEKSSNHKILGGGCLQTFRTSMKVYLDVSVLLICRRNLSHNWG